VAELQEEILCLYASLFYLLLVLVQVLFFFEFDLTLYLKLEFRLLLVVSVISLNFILSSLLIVSLLGPRHIVLIPDVLFCYLKFLVTGHIRFPN
jgi:hypothetical protein